MEGLVGDPAGEPKREPTWEEWQEWADQMVRLWDDYVERVCAQVRVLSDWMEESGFEDWIENVVQANYEAELYEPRDEEEEDVFV